MDESRRTQELFGSDDFSGVRLTEEDLADLQELCERCGDYYRLITGSPAGPAEANFLCQACPEGITPEDKWVVGCYDSADRLFGVLDLVPDYPEEGTWTLGLLLLAPDYRGRGLGTDIFEHFARWAVHRQVRSVWLSVAEQNEAAYRFWRRVGFEEKDRLPPQFVGNRETIIIRLARPISE